jgi:hypothetical protein
MEPRWTGQEFNRKNDFLGAVEQFDLWLVNYPAKDDTHTWVVVTWGPDYSEYNRYRILGVHLDLRGYWLQKTDPTEQEILLIEHYLSLFAPALGLVSRYTEDITNGT